MFRHRAYFDSKFSDCGAFIGSAGPNFTEVVSHRLTPPTFVLATGSGSIASPAAGAGYPVQAHVEFNAIGQKARVRVYAPSIRVVSQSQPTQPTAGASPYTYSNTSGSPQMVYIAGGTVSAITISRQGSSLTTGFISGAFRISQGDSITVTYSVIPTVTIVPDEQNKS
jgi:hypothetical protein